MDAHASAPPRRYEALAYILERMSRGEGCPSYVEIRLKLGISDTRVKQFVRQLIAEGVLAKIPGAKRALTIRDITRARSLVVDAIQARGNAVAQPLGPLVGGFPNGQLPVLPAFEHIPDVD